MKPALLKTATTILKVATSGVVVTILLAFMVNRWEDRREQRGALETLMTVWHGVYLGNHRDSISGWLISPDGAALRDLPEPEYSQTLIKRFEQNQTPTSAILSVAEFFQTIGFCIHYERCDSIRIQEAFGPKARGFHDLFGPLLRHMDCVQGYSGTEDPVLTIAGRSDAVPDNPEERCNAHKKAIAQN